MNLSKLLKRFNLTMPILIRKKSYFLNDEKNAIRDISGAITLKAVT